MGLGFKNTQRAEAAGRLENCGARTLGGAPPASGQLSQCWLGAAQNVPGALVPHHLILLAGGKYIVSFLPSSKEPSRGQNFSPDGSPWYRSFGSVTESGSDTSIPRKQVWLLKEPMTPLQDNFPNKQKLCFNFTVSINICFHPSFSSHLHSTLLFFFKDFIYLSETEREHSRQRETQAPHQARNQMWGLHPRTLES